MTSLFELGCACEVPGHKPPKAVVGRLDEAGVTVKSSPEGPAGVSRFASRSCFSPVDRSTRAGARSRRRWTRLPAASTAGAVFDLGLVPEDDQVIGVRMGSFG